jgi:uncharacterized LabA/DUF88 family protein
MRSWIEALPRHAILAHQQFANTVGKNASDIALVIDAMDLVHSGRLDGVCLVSSDSDFTRLAARIREQGIDVFGFGEMKTPESFRQACRRFIYTENLLPEAPAPEPGKGPDAKARRSPGAALPLLKKAIEQMDDEDGWVDLGGVGQRLGNLAPDFDPRSFGCVKLSDLVARTGAFETRKEAGGVRIRLCPPKKKPRAKKA